MMIKLDENDKKFINENFENADELINSDDVNDVLDEIDDLILYKGFISHEEGYNNFGREAQKIYDNIYRNN